MDIGLEKRAQPLLLERIRCLGIYRKGTYLKSSVSVGKFARQHPALHE